MRTLMIGLLVAGLANLAHAGPPKLYADDGTYLGNFGSKFDPESINNQFGRYGSKFSPDSINNQFGVYGSPYSPQSPNSIYNQPAAPSFNPHKALGVPCIGAGC